MDISDLYHNHPINRGSAKYAILEAMRRWAETHDTKQCKRFLIMCSQALNTNLPKEGEVV